jgi:Uma2 family endonuclease
MQAHDIPSRARPRRLTRSEYDQLVAQGLFRNERVELIGGIVVEMAAIGPRHADPVDLLNRTFVRGLGDRGVVRVQHPFIAADESEPQPDLALVPARRYADHHPHEAFLIVEVADASLNHDRETKGPLYAASGVPEYWIVDIKARCVEVHDELVAGRYGRTRRVSSAETLAPAAFPDLVLRVGDRFV